MSETFGVRRGKLKRVMGLIESVEPRLMLSAAPGDAKARPLAKIDSALVALYEQAATSPKPASLVLAAAAAAALMHVSADAVAIDATAADGVASSQLLADLTQLGLRHGAAYATVVSGYLPLSAVDDASQLGSLRFAAPSYYATNAELQAATLPAVGAATSQGDQAVRGDIARSIYQVDGTGATVGVLSDSFDRGPGAYADDVASGDLPPNVNVLDDTATLSGPATDAGRAMLQAVHDVAPGAALAFHSAAGGVANFASGINDLRQAGATVLADDITYFEEPMFQDGVVAKAVDAAVASGASYFSAAGDRGRNSYESSFRPSTPFSNGQIPSAAGSIAFTGGIAHDFDPGAGVDTFQRFTLNAGESVVISFQWDQPYKSAGPIGAKTDFDIYVLNADASVVVGGRNEDNVSRGDPVEFFRFTNNTGAAADFNLMITRFGDPDPSLNTNFLKYVNFGVNRFAEYDTGGSTIFGHANAAGSETVAAANYARTPAFGVNPAEVESFSGRGGTPILFGANGVRLANPVQRDKPRLTGPDNVNNTFFGTDSPDDADALPNFVGTSAAAAHAAGVAALMQDAVTGGVPAPAAVYAAMEAGAADMDNPDLAGFQTGRDDATGFGLIQADAAIRFVLPPSPAPAVAPNLNATFDTGVSATDNITRLNNSSASTSLQFTVTGTTSGATLTVFADGVPIGSVVSTGGTIVVGTDGQTTLADGSHVITIRQTIPNRQDSADSPPLTIVVDTTAPTIGTPESGGGAIIGSQAWTAAFLNYLTTNNPGVGGYALPSGAAQSAPLPWSNLNQIRLRFSEPIVVGDSVAFSLTGVNRPSYTVSNFSLDDATQSAVWTLSTALINDRLRLSIGASFTDRAGNPFAGGSPNNLAFNVLPGDVDQSGGAVIAPDLVKVRNGVGLSTVTPGSGTSVYRAFYDLNGDGIISAPDLVLVRNRIGTALPNPSGLVARSLFSWTPIKARSENDALGA